MEWWQELIIVSCVGGIAGVLGGFIGISLSARSEIRRRRAIDQRMAQRQRVFDIAEPFEAPVDTQGKKDGQV